MSILSRLARKASRTAQARTPWLLLAGLSQPATPWRYETQVMEAYGRNVIAQRSVRLVAESAASATWISRPAGHPALSLLATPNPALAGPAFLEAAVSQLLLAGNLFIETVTGPDGLPAELHLLRPDRMTIEPGPAGVAASYRYTVGGQSVRFGVDPASGRSSVLHVRSFHPLDDWLGLSTLEAAMPAIDIHNAASRWNKALLDNAARPSGALVFEPADKGGTLSSDQYDRLRAEMEASFAGALNAGRPLLLEGGLKWQPLSMTPADMDFIAAKNTAAREIALAFGVPPMLLGIPGDNTYANYQEANRALWRLTLLPLIAKLAAALSHHLQQWWPDLSLDIDRDHVPALSADRERLWRQVASADFLTDEEKRRLLGCEGM